MLKKLLTERKAAIVQTWQTSIFATYPSDTAKFLQSQKDPFHNPVGSVVSNNIERIYDALLQDAGDFTPFLEDIIKIRAVQDFAPSQAVIFTFLLKEAIRGEVNPYLPNERLLGELLLFEDKIDRLALSAFDVYMQCREKIYEIRIAGIKKWSRPVWMEGSMPDDSDEKQEK